MGVLINMLNDESTNTVQKISVLDIDEISPNPLNHAPIINIEELAAAIKENGLQNPLHVYKKGNHDYVLINGERRYSALKLLDIDEVPVIIKPSPASEIEEKLMILDANAQRDETPEYKQQRAKEYEEIYHHLKANNMIPTGTLKIDWIGTHMGLSGRQVQRYLKKDNPKEKKSQSNEEYYADLAEDFRSKLKTKVTFKKNSFTIGFKNEQELNRILEILDIT